MRLATNLSLVLLHPRWIRCGQASCEMSPRKCRQEKNGESDAVSSCSLRQEALKLRGKRDRYFSMASVAFRRGQGKLAKLLAEKGHQSNNIMKTLNKQAASRRLATENSLSQSQTVNVHGLYVKEAISVIGNFLDRQLHQGQVTIITGWGKNSAPHPPRLLPAVKLYLSREGYDFREPNAGVLEVSLWKHRKV